MLIELFSMPLLAVDIGSIIFFLFLLFSFFGFISNVVKGNAGNQPQGRGRQPRRGGAVQNEIDDFLKEVLGDQPGQKQPQRRAPQRPRAEAVDDNLEVIDDDAEVRRLEQQRREREERERRQRELRQRQEQERREQQRRRQEAERRRREVRQKPETASPVEYDDKPQRPPKKLKDRHIQSSVESHVKTYMTHTVEQQQLDRGTVAPLAGTGMGGYQDQSGADQSSQIAQDLHAILKSPQGVRQAILVNEILSKPKALR